MKDERWETRIMYVLIIIINETEVPECYDG